MVEGLQAAHYEVEWCRDGAEGFNRLLEDSFSLLLLDLMLPGMDGWTICRRLRDRRDTTPILMLTARDEVEDRVRGLNLGADDYLPKPFAFSELKARIAALLRRENAQRRRILTVADVSIDTEAREVTRAGKPLILTQREYDLLVTLAMREGHTVSKETILEAWGDTESISNVVEVHLAALRRKVDGDRLESEKLIQTVYRYGYILRDPARKTETDP